VNERPEKPAHANSEKECERKEIREGKLLGVGEGAEGDCAESDEGESYETEKTTADVLVVEGMAARL